MITYREATADDLPAICQLGQDINGMHHAAWPEIFAPSGDPRRDESLWRESIAAQHATTFVAATADGIVGFVSIVFVERDPNPLLQPIAYARVGSVGVAQSHRGRGIGTGLMQQAEAWAVARGARQLTLHVWAFNERALALYERLGYAVRSHSMGKRLAGS